MNPLWRLWDRRFWHLDAGRAMRRAITAAANHDFARNPWMFDWLLRNHYIEPMRVHLMAAPPLLRFLDDPARVNVPTVPTGPTCPFDSPSYGGWQV